MEILALVLRWAHILGALVLVGGTILLQMVVVPSLANLDDENRKRVNESIRARWATLVMFSIGLLLVSGIANIGLMAGGGEFKQVPSFYHHILGFKFLLALVAFYIVSLLAGRSAAAERLREKLPPRLQLAATILVLIVCLAGGLKMVERGEVDPDPPNETARLETGVSE